MDQLSLHLLGGFAVHDGDRPVELPPASQRLIALVALRRRPVHRLWLCATLWPHVQTRRAVSSLRSALWRLRPEGADHLLAADPQYLQLAPDVDVDWYRSVDLIEQLLDGNIDARLVTELLPLLRSGELLDKWAEPWVAGERTKYHAMRISAIDALGHRADKQLAHLACATNRTSHVQRPARDGSYRDVNDR